MFKIRLLPMTIAMMVSISVNAQDEASEDPAIEEVIVQGVRNAELNALAEERKKEIFSSVISQDDAGNFADQNVAESLQRLPGITLQKSEGEGKFVTVRGLGPGFVTVNMDGAEVASGGGGFEADAQSTDNRGFALDAIPADLLGSIEVLKSLTPDMDLNSIGGAVNVKTISAFDKGRDTLKFASQASFQDYSGEMSPKISTDGTFLLADGTVGLGFAVSTEERITQVNEQRHHNDEQMLYIQPDIGGPVGTDDPNDPRILVPFEFETRQENAERERNAGSLNLGFRPTETSEYTFRAAITEFTDLDIALREYYRFGQAIGAAAGTDPDNTAFVDSDTRTFGLQLADLQQQFFIQESTTTTQVFALGGKNLISGWNLDYEYAHSTSELDKPDGRRVQFRSQDVPVLGRFGQDFLNGQVISADNLSDLSGVTVNPGSSSSNYVFGERRQPNMSYDNIFIEDSFREDTIDQMTANLRKDLDGIFNYVKTGIMIKNRERSRNKDRWSLDPSPQATSDFGCGGNAACEDASNSALGDWGTYVPENPAFDHEFITLSETERLLELTEPIARSTDPNRTDVTSTQEDYLLTEDTMAVYLMAELSLSDRANLIVGGRYDQTDFSSTGFLSIRNDRLEDPGNPANFDIAVPLDNVSENSYNNFFPSAHLRYELTDEILVRTSLWTSFSRPDFDDARSFAEIEDRVIFCDPNDPNNCSDEPDDVIGGTATAQDVAGLEISPDNTLRLGNPLLKPMLATNLDASISWYASDDLFLQAALFYKNIDDFIVNISGAALPLNELPISLPVDEVTQFIIPEDIQFAAVNFATNGRKAEVYGMELSYSQYFTQGLLEGFFLQSNATLLSSEAEVGDTLRTGKIELPDQADQTLNLVVGWENEDISARLINNFRSKVLKRIGACTAGDIAADDALGFPQNCQTWGDVYQDDSYGLDIKATYQITDAIKLSFDALNVTEEKDIHYFRGNSFSGGPVLFRYEDYGSSFQLGLNMKIY